MKKKQKKLVIGSLDKIYTTAIEITKAYNSEYIPLNLLDNLIIQSKFPITEKALDEFRDKYNNMLTTLYTVSKGYCEQYETNERLPMIVFKRYIKQLKENL